jgi:hypothetical protein
VSSEQQGADTVSVQERLAEVVRRFLRHYGEDVPATISREAWVALTAHNDGFGETE